MFPDGPASSTVSVRATDSDGDTGPAGTQDVTVRNVPPTATLSPGNPRTVDEGPAQHTYTFSVSDPGQDTVQSIDASCGTGGTLVAGLGDGVELPVRFPDGPASPTVSVRATDSDGDTGAADTQTVTVRNVPPTATFDEGNDVVVNGGRRRTRSRSRSTDPGQDTVERIDASCGTGGTLVEGSVTTTNFACVFTGSGYMTISVSATDSDNDTGPTDTQEVLVYAFPGNGRVSFVISDRMAAVGNTVTFWGAQWSREESAEQRRCRAEQLQGIRRAVRGRRRAVLRRDVDDRARQQPRAAGRPAARLHGRRRGRRCDKSGSTISGDVRRIVVVKTNPGYAPNPGHEGTGKIIAVDCG